MRKRWLTRKKLILVAIGPIAILTILLIFAHPSASIKHARESLLRQDLRVMRDAIDQYTLDHNRAPQSLQDLVDANYLKEIPKDPITSDKDWHPVFEDPPMGIDPAHPGIEDAHSGSHKKAQNGTTYDSW